MRPTPPWLVLAAITLASSAGASGKPATKAETFDRDPGWEGVNNRPSDRNDQPVIVRQDFGFTVTSHAGGAAPGEIGGFVQAAAEPAFYGKVIPDATLQKPLTASGTLAVADGGTNLLVGFFNASTTNEWRTPNTLAIRVNGRGDHFFGYLEYCTSKWRAGADSPQSFPADRDPQTGRLNMAGFPSGKKVHAWTISYDPAGNNGGGAITATIDGKPSVCHLDPGHKRDGATFNRFGILNVTKSFDGGTEIYLDDVTVNGQRETFDKDPQWDGRNNRKTYPTNNVRPRFDFGFSATSFAGGKSPGEMGGLVFRGDCREPSRMACYGDKLGPLTLDKPIRAFGKVTMLRGVSDSTTLFGFYNHQSAMRSNPSQKEGIPEGVLGINIEGPSSEGFCFYPLYRPAGGEGKIAPDYRTLRILPDRVVHAWQLDYDPAGASGHGRITVTLGGRSIHMDLADGDKAKGTRFDRFGIVTPWIDGNGQLVYFDDITYTVGQ
jgi:hypothetical protein